MIIDRRCALMGIPDPASPEGGFPTVLLVEAPGFAGLQATAFDHMWDAGVPYDEVVGIAGVAEPATASSAGESPGT